MEETKWSQLLIYRLARPVSDATNQNMTFREAFGEVLKRIKAKGNIGTKKKVVDLLVRIITMRVIKRNICITSRKDRIKMNVHVMA